MTDVQYTIALLVFLVYAYDTGSEKMHGIWALAIILDFCVLGLLLFARLSGWMATE